MTLKLKNYKILIFSLLLLATIAIYWVSYRFGRDIVHFYAYSQLYYIPIIIAAFLYKYRYAIVFPLLAISGKLLTLYLLDKSNPLLWLFEISIPIYFVVFALIAKLKVKTEAVQEYYSKFSQGIQDTIDALLSALEAKDLYTHDHSKRVSRLAKLIAQKMDLASKEIEKIYLAARLHDIGKIGINTTILNKPQKLSAEEFAHIKDHPIIGAEIIKKVNTMADLVPLVTAGV